MADPGKHSKGFGSARFFGYIKHNPHMAVSVGLFCGGGVALAFNVAPLAGSLFGAGGALLGAWITELNKRRTDAEDKATRQAEAADALAPEVQRTIERVLYILDRAAVNFGSESSINGVQTNDLQIDFRPYLPTLYPSAPQVRDLPGDRAIALIRYYDSLNEIAKLVDDWWEREGQLAVNIFNGILHAAEKSLRLGLVCIREFDLDERFPPQYESWGSLTSRIERSLANAAQTQQHHQDRAEARRLDPIKSKEATPFRTY
jgi:hypothetical protein